MKIQYQYHASGVELEAKSVDYTPGEANAVGSLMAIGPGWIRAVDEKAASHRVSLAEVAADSSG